MFVTRFSWFGRYTGVEGGVSGLPVGVFEIAVVIRAIILILCVVGWVRGRHGAVTVTESDAERSAEEPSPEGAVAG